MTTLPEQIRLEPDELDVTLTPDAEAFVNNEEIIVVILDKKPFGYIVDTELEKLMDDHGLIAEDHEGVVRYFEEQGVDVVPEGAQPDQPETPFIDKRAEGTTDLLQLFLREAGKHELLTADQEVELAKRKEEYVNLREAAREEAALLASSEHRKPTSEDFARILTEKVNGYPIEKKESLQDSKWALDELQNCNLRLVVSIAKNYRNSGVPLLDLIQEGSVGLIRAAEKFDWRKGFKFSTYATWWIKQAVTRALADKSRTIRMPVHVVEKLNKIIKTERRLTQALGKEPSPAEIANELGMTEEKVIEILRYNATPASFDKPIGEDEETKFGDLIADPEAEDPFEVSDLAIQRDTVLIGVKALPDRERRIIELRFGLNDEPPRTLEEVGKELKVTRERARQIELDALRRLAKFEEIRKLAEKGESGGNSLPIDPQSGKPVKLSPSEKSVMRLLDRESTLKDIADTMHVSEADAKAIKLSAYKKLGVTARADAIPIFNLLIEYEKTQREA